MQQQKIICMQLNITAWQFQQQQQEQFPRMQGGGRVLRFSAGGFDAPSVNREAVRFFSDFLQDFNKRKKQRNFYGFSALFVAYFLKKVLKSLQKNLTDMWKYDILN